MGSLPFAPPCSCPPLYPRWADLDDCAADVALRHSLWVNKQSWEEATAGWLEGSLSSVDCVAMDEALQMTNKLVYKMERGLVPNKVL